MKKKNGFHRRSKYDRPSYDLTSLPADHIDRLTLERVTANSTVLELGCATGYMSEYMINKLGCQVTALEVDAAAARYARQVGAMVHVGDINQQATWQKLRGRRFQTILAANVIEHLVNPDWQLQQIVKHLQPDGKFIIVVPNIAWWRSRWRLLLGKWQYEEYGLFDRTHLQFFSLFSLRRQLTQAGLQIIDEAYDPAGGAKWLTPLLKLFPNAYAYQMVVVCEKKRKMI